VKVVTCEIAARELSNALSRIWYMVIKILVGSNLSPHLLLNW